MSTSESLTSLYAVEQFDDPSRQDVARAYLRAEMPNIILGGDIAQSLDTLSDHNIGRLLEAISYTYRINGVFHAVTDTSLEWAHADLPIGAISLTGTKPHINDIVYSDEISNDPRRFADYLHDYFADHEDLDDDPLGLNEFRPRVETIDPSLRTLLTLEKNDRIDMLDGTHRLIAMAMLGASSVRAFVGIPSGSEHKHMIGDSTFVTLRMQYETAETDEAREQIIAVTVGLCHSSTDGRDAVKTYWIDHPRDEAIKAAGAEILLRLSES